MLTLEELVEIRKLTIIALFSDDDLMFNLVLKGGNALEIGYGLNSRASIDIDVSMINEFKDVGLHVLEDVQDRLKNALNRAFEPEGYKVFDVKIKEVPKKINENMQGFWGAYEASFKIIDPEEYEKHKENYFALNAKSFSTNEGKKKVVIDFGRFEYCESRISHDLDGYFIQIYTPELIVFEKLRAICQQMPEYLKSIGKDPEFGRPRPRDFYDIHTILESDKIPELNLGSKENQQHLLKCFEVKKVPNILIAAIKNTYQFHAQEESKLRDSILNKEEYAGFEYYFNYVVEVINTKILVPEKI